MFRAQHIAIISCFLVATTTQYSPLGVNRDKYAKLFSVLPEKHEIMPNIRQITEYSAPFHMEYYVKCRILEIRTEYYSAEYLAESIFGGTLVVGLPAS